MHRYCTMQQCVCVSECVCVCMRACVCVDRMNLKCALHWHIYISAHSVLWWWSLFIYSTILHSRADSLHLCVLLHEWIAVYSAFFEYPLKWCTFSVAWLMPHESAAVSVHHVYHAPCNFMQSHISKVNECLAVTCHLHFWWNDRGLLRSTVVTQGVERIPK